MKTKHLMLLAIAACTFSNASAQLYFTAGGGYGLGMDRDADSDTKYTTDGINFSQTFTSRPYSFGQGAQFGISGGYMLGKHVGAELGISWLMGSTFTTTSEYMTPFSNSKTTYEKSGSMLRIVPALRLSAGEGKLTAYTRTGLIIGLLTKVEASEAYSGMSNTELTEWELTGGLSLGFHGAAGIRYAVSSRIGIFCEVNANLQAWSPQKGKVLTYKVNGIDLMSQLTTSEKEVEFEDEYTSSSNANPNQPDKTEKIFLPFSSLGLQLGIHFSLGGKE